jgi:hypothetical protein
MATPYSVAVAAETALASLLEEGEALEGVTIDIREPAAVDPERDSAALAAAGLLILTPETEGWKTLTFGKAQLALALRVTLVAPGNLQFADRTALAFKHSAREAIWTALLQQGVLSLDGVTGGTYEPEPAYDTGTLERLYRVSKQRFTWIATANRGATS